MKKLLENKVFRICLISIIVIALIIIIAIVVMANINGKVTQASIVKAAQRYYENNPGLLPTENYDSSTVYLSTLVLGGYINGESEGANCPSYVIVTNINGKYSYTATNMCGTTTLLAYKLKNNVVTSGAGLYNVNGTYVFRGENPNNYINLGNTKWRIIGLDENNNIKLIYNDSYIENLEWDDRYNKDMDDQVGINDYLGNEKSRIKAYLDTFFTSSNMSEEFTGNVLSLMTPHSVCVGKIDVDNNNNNVCSNILDNQRVSTITVGDYINASLDPSCSYNNSINCQNYNFLNSNSWTITATSRNTYQVYRISTYNGLQLVNASNLAPIKPVVALRNNVLYVSGSGTELDPYIIK